MRALIYDGKLHFSKDFPDPAPGPGQAFVRVIKAGICRTDLEICKVYAGLNAFEAAKAPESLKILLVIGI